MSTVIGTIEFIRFQSPSNGFVVATLRPLDDSLSEGICKDGTFSVAGILPGVRKGMSVKLEGEVEASKYGPTFKFTSWSEHRPSDVEGIEKYLASGLVHNIGEKYAKLIVNAFGEQTLEVMDNRPELLRSIKGIGKKRVESIIAAVNEQREIRDIMIWLKRYDISNGLAVKIYQTYQGRAIAVLEENPYMLVDDIGGVGFKKADEVALKLGIEPTSPFRLRSGILAALRDMADGEGHTCLPADELVPLVASKFYLNIDEEYVRQTLSDPEFLDVHVILNDDGQYALPMYHFSEVGIARRLRRLLSVYCQEVPVGAALAALEEEKGIVYTEEQREAVRLSAERNVLVLTGGPGTGKTATTNAIIRNFEAAGMTVILAAPTGRAAKRMTEMTGRPAKTIHRLLGWSFDEFSYNETNPLDGDVFIIDEVSMIDTLLMNHLLKAIPDGGRLVLVGDVDQLPSVGAGAVLLNIIDSGIVPTVRLTKIHRQAQSSRIITNAHRINHGEAPDLEPLAGTDFYFVETATPEAIQERVTTLVTKAIPQRFGFAPKDIQVLCPMKRVGDPIASTALNVSLQELLNADGVTAAQCGDVGFRVGDRVMQMQNNYEKDIFNGDMGVVLEKLPAGREDKAVLRVNFDGRLICLTQTELQQVSLSYACTIHKSQGSEYPVVVIPVHESNYIMLKRNLLYTGVTRAKNLCVLVGTRKAVNMAVSRPDTSKRWTNLEEKLVKP